MSPVLLLWFISGCLMLQSLSTDLYLASLPNLASYFGATPAAVQQTLSLFVIGFGTAQLISGPLSDRFGRQPVIAAGLLTYVLASIACAAAPTLPLLTVARFAQAVGSCTAAVVTRAIIRDAYSPAEGARIIAKASTILSLAPIFGPIAGGYLEVHFGWRAAFVVHALFGSLLGWLAWRRLGESNRHKNPRATDLRGLATSYVGVAASPAFWAYALPGALSYSAIFVFIAGSSFALIGVLGVPTQYYGYCFGLGVVGYLFGTLLCRRLLGRIGLPRTVSVGASLALSGGLIFAALVFAGIHHWSVVVLSMFVTMGSHGINYPCAQAGAVAPFPQQAGAAAALLGFFIMLAALLIGTVVGVSLDGTLFPMAIISAVNGILLFASTHWMARHRAAALSP